MARFLVFAFLFLIPSVPASGKAPKDTYPVSCDALWSAVSDTLGNAGNYSILASDDTEMKASFTVVGAQRQRVNAVSLNPKDSGCEMQVQFPDSGFEDNQEGVFKKRVGHSLARMQAAKPSPPGKPDEKK
jgi:hypothetical protein